ncbi:cobalamin binding intrinsic factor-like [Pipra filicauda]|uniref:Cobalamin binding intrinsic factor-like n=1 Tax=Pipra filicauda TaxID=649802 RepID=A0A7R5KX65_9PASS|nr:cobalamin binding intrinsic factor-like [Pipra filicauda]
MGHGGPGDLLPSGPEGCWATASCDQLVRELLRRMEESIQPHARSNPSVLLAMNLLGADIESPTYRLLLQEIKEEVVTRAQKAMTSGQVAEHILALLSSCQDPRQVPAPEEPINLIPILQQKMHEEITHNVISWYNRSLDILTLCVVKEHDRGAAVALAKELLSPDSHLDVDTRAMAVLALVCENNTAPYQEHLIQWALGNVTNGLLDEQEKGEGVIGNLSSMGLPIQALESSRKFYAPRRWDRAQAFHVVQTHEQEYTQPMAIARVLPGLVGTSYLNAAPLTVQYSITNTMKNYFHYSTSVCVPPGSRLLRVLQVARDEKPHIFSFKTVNYDHLGPFVVSIHGLAGNETERTYWQFFSCWSPLQQGVGTYRPKNWEHIQAIFSTY